VRRRSSKKGGSIAFRALTPMLDALFILLFALLALSDSRRVEEETVSIQLPSVEPGGVEAELPGQRVTIVVDAESRISLGGAEPIGELAELDEQLGRTLGDHVPEEVLVEIRADEDSRHGVSVELLQHLRLRGFVNVQLLALASEEAPR
jgi:biopolymer transport protein ExbD